jgi:hypothetical protein
VFAFIHGRLAGETVWTVDYDSPCQEGMVRFGDTVQQPDHRWQIGERGVDINVGIRDGSEPGDGLAGDAQVHHIG